MKLAILILHYNTPDLTTKLADSIEGSIVIDNGSSPANAYKGSRRVIRQGNFGFTKGWNEAMKAVYNEFDAFWLMNSDIRISASSVERIKTVLKRQHVDLVSPSYNCWMKDGQNHNSGDIREVGCIEFTAPVIKKSVIEKIGFFDERFVRGYGVEFDYCYRMREAGLKIWVDDISSFYHIGQQTIKKNGSYIEYSKTANLELTSGLLKKYGMKYKDIVFKGISIPSDFNMSIAIYTTIFGDYAPLRKVPFQSVKADYYCITDNPGNRCEGWKTIVVDRPRADLHPRMRAKFYKLFPWELPELAKNEISIYIDGSIEITEPNFIEYCIKNLTGDMLLFKHPNRICIYEEARASVGLKKYLKENIAGQIKHYQEFHPKNFGLWACGVMIRKHTDKVKAAMSAWWWENINWTYQDQLSFPVVCRLLNFKPDTFNENQYHSGYFKVHWHDDVEKQSVPVKRKNEKTEIKKLPEKKLSVSVLMSVYNTPVAEANQAISSILKQIHYDFQFVIVDDNSTTPDLLKYLNLLKDKRINLVRNKSNKGLAYALNMGLKYCTGDIVVRMDADDIASPYLISHHLDYFTRNPESVICGVQISGFGEKTFKTYHPPVVTREMAARNDKFWFVNHPGVAFKKAIVESVGAYGTCPINLPEDYHLWCKLLKAGFVINNMPDVLIRYRVKRKEERNQDEWVKYLEDNRKMLVL